MVKEKGLKLVIEEREVKSKNGKKTVKVKNVPVIYKDGKEYYGGAEYKKIIEEEITEAINGIDEEEVLTEIGKGKYEVDINGRSGIWRYGKKLNLKVGKELENLGMEDELSKVKVSYGKQIADEYVYKGRIIKRARIKVLGEERDKSVGAIESKYLFDEEPELALKMKSYVETMLIEGEEINYNKLRAIISGDGVSENSKGILYENRVSDGYGTYSTNIKIKGRVYRVSNIPTVYVKGVKDPKGINEHFEEVVKSINEYEEQESEYIDDVIEIDIQKYIKYLGSVGKNELVENIQEHYGKYLVDLYTTYNQYKGVNSLDKLGVTEVIREEDYKYKVGTREVKIKGARVKTYVLPSISYKFKYKDEKNPLECGYITYQGIKSYAEMTKETELDYTKALKSVGKLLNKDTRYETRIKYVDEECGGIKLKNVGHNVYILKDEEGNIYEDMNSTDKYEVGELGINIIIGYAKYKGIAEVDVEKSKDKITKYKQLLKKYKI